MLQILLFVVHIWGIHMRFAEAEIKLVDAEKCLVWGAGIKPDVSVLPARYFFIMAVDKNGQRYVCILQIT